MSVSGDVFCRVGDGHSVKATGGSKRSIAPGMKGLTFIPYFIATL